MCLHPARLSIPALALVLVVACGDDLPPAVDGAPLSRAHDLVIVAHQDDDLIFMQPDLLEAVRGGRSITTVYVTAGNGQDGTATADRRDQGLREAYGEAAGVSDWRCDWLDLAGHPAERCQLLGAGVTLVFLGYPDGGKQGEQPSSLLHLWQGAIEGADTVADVPSHLDREGLIETVAAVIESTHPAIIRTLEVASTHGRDHSDHMVVGALALVAAARAASDAEVISYRGYNISDEPVNKLDPVYDQAADMLSAYEACTSCGCGAACAPQPPHVTWLHRRYAVGFRRAARGRLEGGGGCLIQAPAGAVALGDCGAAPSWRLDDPGDLRLGDRCLAADPGGGLRMTACDGGVDHRWFFDDEGHLWSGLPPAPAGDMRYAHLLCLAAGESGPRVALCGAPGAPVWSFAPAVAVTARAELGLSATGRAVQIGDLTGDGRGDLCAVQAGGLMCAPGDGAGHFGPAIRIDDPAAPLAVNSASLVLGDVNGDGRADACGRTAAGLRCALAAVGFAAAPWSRWFSDADAQPATSASLAAVNADGDGVQEICGLAVQGVICAPHGLSTPAAVRSPWPSQAGAVWVGDLDGDGRSDWCASSGAGPACGVAAEAAVTTDGAPWGFARTGRVAAVAPDPATVALGDVAGDGRASLCTLAGDRIACAHSQARGFGPRETVALLPDQAAPVALWLGDLDGDGTDDACADAGAIITCVLSARPGG